MTSTTNKITVNSLILDGLNESELKYLSDTEAKHFNPEMAAGSLFLDIKTLRDLLAVAENQRGSLEGDDRDQLIDRGVPAEALLPFCRYLVVKTRGEVGIVKSSDLPIDQTVYVVKMKPDIVKDGVTTVTPPSLLTAFDDFPIVDFGVIILGPRDQNDTSKGEIVWTCHPGLPIRPQSDTTWEHGSTITAGQVEEKLPGFWLNIKRSSEVENLLKKYNF